MRVFAVFAVLIVGAIAMIGALSQSVETAALPPDPEPARSAVFEAPMGRLTASVAEDGDRLRLDVVVSPRAGDVSPLRTAARLADGQHFALRVSAIAGIDSVAMFEAVRHGNGVVLRLGDETSSIAALGDVPTPRGQI
ncbi:MAG: hypothetical protein ACFBWO_11115 [Paracoccaceae bacterium]